MEFNKKSLYNESLLTTRSIAFVALKLLHSQQIWTNQIPSLEFWVQCFFQSDFNQSFGAKRAQIVHNNL